MKFTVTIFIYLILVSPKGSCQNILSGNSFVNEKLEQIEFIGDSILRSTFEWFPDRYKFGKRRIDLKFSKKHPQSEYFKYIKIESFSVDKVLVTYVWTGDNKPVKSEFTNVDKLYVPIVNFDSMTIYVSGMSGYQIIRYKKDLNLIKRTAFRHDFIRNTSKEEITTLNKEQYDYFLKTLSRALIFKLPLERKFTATDEAQVDIAIYTNGQVVTSNGGTLSGVHRNLLHYLLGNK